jgi:hypothetical protein
VYLAGAQLLLSHGPRSIVPSMCGLLASLAYHSSVLGLKGLSPPHAVCRVLKVGR